MSKKVEEFQKEVWKYYHTHGRHDLPWRKTRDPYKILVSEIMLQQTQVSRVLEKYKEFLTNFPTVYVLAQATLTEVIRTWSGLGYNRRGKYLHDSAKMIVTAYNGDFVEALVNPLPGVGPYTRAAVRTFAFNEPHTMIETNIRAVYIHHFFKEGKPVSDKELIPLIEKAMPISPPAGGPREWHWALMDYGSYLKKQFPNPSRRSAGYTKQSKFEGSLRQVRGMILRELHKGPSLLNSLPVEKERVDAALASLKKHGMIKKIRGRWSI
ncbi:MAG: endonuclease [Candidatus Kaiserbacteria bacterium]|nr:endonuclease [Candidatus Kaiserbacteria bacterium]